MDNPFEVGKRYRNRRGEYEVLAINDPKMRVRYENGREMNLTIAIQTQIYQNIQPHEAAAPKKGAKRIDKGSPERIVLDSGMRIKRIPFR